MPFLRPSLTTIVQRIQGDIKTGLSLPAILRRSVLDILSRALGAASHTIHGHIDWAVKQLLVDSADDEYAIRWGTIFGVARNPATFAKLNVTVAGTVGGTAPDGFGLQRNDGVVYAFEGDVVVGASPATATGVVVCTSLAGAAGNMEVGDTLQLISPISGVNSTVTILSVNTEGEDQETIPDYRTRIIERIQQPPSGGTVNDYIAYAKTVTGVTRVWVLPNNQGQGTVGLTFVEDNEDPIIPSPAKVAEVQAAVEELQPITADLNVFAPNDFPLDITVQISPNTVAVQEAITQELTDMLLREAQVRDAVDPMEVGIGTIYNGKILLSKINEAISIAADENDHVITTPVADVQPPSGGIVTLGTITFQTLVT